MKRFLRNAAVFASLAFCGLFILSNDVFADGGYYGFSQDSITLAPDNTGSVTTIAAPNDAGRRVSAGDAVFSGVNNDCVSASIAPTGYGSWGTGGSINVNNVNTSGTLEIGTVSISAKNVSVSCSATVTISGELMDHQDGTSRSSASLTIYVVAPEPTPASSDNQITGLTPSAGTASGSGSNWTISDVPRDATSITLTPSLPAGASVSGGSPVTCTLSGDSSACNFTVVAEDGTPKDYIVTINKKSEEPTPEPTPTKKSSDATLKSLNASGYNLNPSFNPNTSSYTINVQNSVDGLNFTAIPNSDKATVEITGNTGWKVGVNTVMITVTAENGSKQTYTVNVIRAKNAEADKAKKEEKKSDNNYLSNLISHDGAISPDFDKNKTSYSVKVPKDVTKLNLTATPEDEKAKVEIFGNENFEIGKTTQVTIVVTAEDGSKRIYTLNVTRENVEAETDLSDLRVSGYSIEPGFDKGINKYSLTVPYDVDHLDVFATAAKQGSRVEIIGNNGLAVGNNTILVKVTDKNGFTHVYELNVRRMEEPTFFGIRRSVWRIIFIVLALLLLLLLLLWLLFRRRREREEYHETPVIDFKPAFNFGSRVGTDDDTVMPSGINNQAESTPATTLTQPQTTRYIENEADSDDDDDDDRKIETVAQPVTATVTPVVGATVTPAMASSMASERSVIEAERRANKIEAERLAAEREKLEEEKAIEAEEVESNDEDIEVVTKDELYDALMDVKENHDSSKLKLLMKQEELNREKEKVKSEAAALKAEKAQQEKRAAVPSLEKAQEEFWG